MRITESQLRRIIREELIREAAVTPSAAVDMGLRFILHRGSGIATIRVVGEDSPHPVGRLGARPPPVYHCADAWVTAWAEATVDGLGPLMYDLMMDLVHPHPLTADRSSVEPSARRVWDHYLNRRAGEIESIQLTNPRNPRNPPSDSDCEQESALTAAEESDPPVTWSRTSLSKAYRRRDGRTPILDALLDAGVVEWSDRPDAGPPAFFHRAT